MGCFTACFRFLTSKHKKLIKSSNNSAIPPSKTQCLHSLLQIHDESENSVKLIADSKKVTLDLDVKTYEECSPNQEDEKSLVENDQGKKDGKKDGEKETETSADSSLMSLPLNRNCRNGDEDLEDFGLEDFDLESSESLFSLSIESRKNLSQADKDEVSSPMKPLQKDMNPNARHRSQFVESVLNTIENTGQWEASKEQKSPPLEAQEKENKNLDLPYSKLKENEIAVETSLSSWLVETAKKTPNSKDSSGSIGNSPSHQKTTKSKKEFGERPILGELNLEDFSALSKFSSPKRSPRPLGTGCGELLELQTAGYTDYQVDPKEEKLSNPHHFRPG